MKGEARDLDEVRPSEASLEVMVARLGTENDARGEDDEIPADKTRIETNPLDRLNELNREPRRTPVPVGSVSGGPAPLPAPPQIGASGRFPDLANLPTMIAEPDDDEPGSWRQRLIMPRQRLIMMKVLASATRTIRTQAPRNTAAAVGTRAALVYHTKIWYGG